VPRSLSCLSINNPPAQITIQNHVTIPFPTSITLFPRSVFFHPADEWEHFSKKILQQIYKATRCHILEGSHFLWLDFWNGKNWEGLEFCIFQVSHASITIDVKKMTTHYFVENRPLPVRNPDYPPSRPTSQKLYCDANLLGNLSWDMVGNALQFFMSITLIVSWGKLDGGTVQLVCEPIPWHLLRNVMMQFVSYLNSRLKAVYLAVNLPSNYIYIAYTDFFSIPIEM